MTAFFERHAAKIRGTLSCFDRVVITGTLPDICHAGAMARQLSTKGVRLFDYPRWAEPFREELRQHAERLARENGLEIEFIQRKDFRKEKRINAILAQRGDHPGLVHIFSAMEPCASFKPWHDKATGQTVLKPTEAKCLHDYFYFIHPELGLGYVRVPTWAPFRLQVYFNGHNALALKLKKQPGSLTPCWTTPSWPLPTSPAPRRWPTPWTSGGCAGIWIDWPTPTARWGGTSRRATTGA